MLPFEPRTKKKVWMGMALWGSVPQTSEEVELMEATLLLERPLFKKAI